MNYLIILIILLIGCSDQSELVDKNMEPPEEWWYIHIDYMKNSFIAEYEIDANSAVQFDIDCSGSRKIGVLVKQALELVEINKTYDFPYASEVILIQNKTGTYIGTNYSAGTLFDLDQSDNFVIMNQTDILLNIALYEYSDYYPGDL